MSAQRGSSVPGTQSQQPCTQHVMYCCPEPVSQGRHCWLSGKLGSFAPPKDHWGLLYTFIKHITIPVRLQIAQHIFSSLCDHSLPVYEALLEWSTSATLPWLIATTIHSFSRDVSAGRDTQNTKQMHSSPALHQPCQGTKVCNVQ